ncbi:complement C3-like [Pimephales promelas]|uniref:complement C3-like n=1 Tax=Pimephales promelas TaxID=90988 RepID=UPI001955AF43|nr:complement C3-like [Pimephales promelas]KAG1955857.1 complement C3 preproprotein [Pimephales promelas]
MEVKLLCLTVFLSSPLLILCDPLFVLSAPNLLRVGSSENVFVEAQDYNGGNLNVRISVKNFPKKDREILSKTVTLTGVNNYQILTDIKIPSDRDYFSDDPLEKQYVYLQAQFPSHTLEKVVMVSFQSGYIFVQTDKPIYTPASTVQYRIFSLTPGLKPLEHAGIAVEIMDPEGITTMRETIFPQQGIRSGKYAVPQPARPGIWKVVTRFANTPQKNYTADFEVKEYVLPTYEVTLSPSQSFFSVKDASLTVSIEAKYLHGNNVNGHAFVVFGVMEFERKTSIPSSLQRVQISDGEGTAKLTKETILQTFPDIGQLVGQSIYISASVLTDTGSEMVEAQRKGIQIVTSPYTIHFERTPQFFKPGMPFSVSVYLTDPDKMPAENVEVEVNPGAVRGRTKANGIAKLTVNSHEGSSALEITVQTKDPKLDDDQQAVKKMTAQAYETKGGSKNYLHVGIDTPVFEIGDQMKVNLNLGRSPGVRDQDFTYMILSKGQIVQANRFKRSGHSLVTLSLPVTKDMVPSFRFVAYYHVGPSEVVSDSVWVDVKDTCMGTLKVQVKEPRPIYEPGEEFSLLITGDPGAKVGLVAVDKAVHGLNQNRLTQKKIYDIVEKHDTGCTAGGGRDSMGVFSDSGLMFESHTAGGTNTRTVPECPVPSKRRRRAESAQRVTTILAGQYSGDLRKCCVDGMRDNKLGYTCERRAMYIVDGEECVRAFLHCCNDVVARSMEAGEEEMILARSEDSDYYESFDEITSRTQFPESWLWTEEILPFCPNNKSCPTTSITRDRIYLKESITTWQIFAFSLSKSHGICVADPYEMIVYKRFFIDLKVPFSAVRNEQLQIRVILHNYTKKKIRARLEFTDTEHICSSASTKGSYQTEVEVESMSSRSVPYVIIPLELGSHWIEVKAAAYDSVYSDGVRKILRVVSEGVLTMIQEKNVELNPTKMGGVQQVSVRSLKPDTQVPNTPANTYITVKSQEFSKMIEKAISGDFMGRFIVQPRGNGEENMIYMTLPVIATHYLDSTKQWETVGMNRRNEAINHINTGYQRELTFRKPDGSFAASIRTTSSTWLTAYVAKVFTMASDLIIIEENVICSALKWLAVNKQLPDGTFKEDAPVIHEEMLGDVQGKDGDASLTAFVLVAMQEGSKICTESSLQGSINRAVNYLTLRVHSLTSGYAVAMTSYALAHAGKLNKDILMSHSSQNEVGRFWQVPGQRELSLEATGYALLALVKVKDFERAGPAVRWLRAQIPNYGASGTTQANIVVFQAVAQYRTEAKKQDVNLNIELSVEGRTTHNRWTFTRSNMHVTRSDKVKLTQKFNLTAHGNGMATLSVYSLYYALPEERENDCNAFDLSVKMEKQLDVSHPGAIESYLLTIETYFKNPARDAAMSVLDIGLLTGFKVDDTDLSKLSKGKEKYIERFEMNMELSERGSLIIFLNKVSHKVRERIAFRMHKINEVGMLQPAGVTVYEYNAPDDRCVKFFHPHKRDGALNRLCHEDLCECAEENCSLQKKHHIAESQRADKACAHGVDYVYKTRVVGKQLSLQADIYNMTIEQVLKEGTDPAVEGKTRSFLAHPYCREFLEFEEGKTYLIMGQTTSLPRIGGRLRYNLGEQTWVEYWPTQEEAQTEKYKDKYADIVAFAEQLFNLGCTT